MAEFWDRARAFHGHECPGLAIGVKLCEVVIEKMGIAGSPDEELVCVTENNACAVDAVQAILGCTFGKGNLVFRETGKMAFTFFARDNGRAARFYFTGANANMERGKYLEYLLGAPARDLFECTEITAAPPGRAQVFSSVVCEMCGEKAAEYTIRLRDGKKVCADCFNGYSVTRN